MTATTEMSLKDMATAYNEIAAERGVKKVSKFSSRKEAENRLALAQYESPAKEQEHEIREGSLIDHMHQALSGKGATLEELAKAVAKYDKANGNSPFDEMGRAKRSLRTLTEWTGFGVRATKDGKLVLVTG